MSTTLTSKVPSIGIIGAALFAVVATMRRLLAGLLAVLVYTRRSPIPPLGVWPSGLWMYAGSCAGLAFIVFLRLAVLRLGMVRVFASVVLGMHNQKVAT